MEQYTPVVNTFIRYWNTYINEEDRQDNTITPDMFISIWENEYGQTMWEPVSEELYYNYSKEKRMPYSDCLVYWSNLHETWLYALEMEGNE